MRTAIRLLLFPAAGQGGDKDLPPAAPDAQIRTCEGMFCAQCIETVLQKQGTCGSPRR